MITLSKLAKLANVSVSTASKAFSGSKEVNEETRSRIFSVAKEHGAFKNFYNVKYPKLVIAVVVPEFQSRNYGPFLSEIQSALEERDCLITVAPSGFLPNENNKIYDYYSKYTDVDGIIIIGKYDHSVDELDIPCVVIGGKGDKDSLTAGVEVSSERALRDALAYLKDRGVEKVGFISEEKTYAKLGYFTSAMCEVYGAFDDRYIVVTKGRFEEGGYEGMKHLVESGNVPRAVMCGYDNMAFGAIRCLKDYGLKVPDDVAVIGYDDNAESKYIIPSLSSIDLKQRDCAAVVADTLIKMIFSNPFEKNTVIDAEFKARESSEIG